MASGPDYPSSNGATDKAWNQSFLRLVVVSYILAVAMPPLGLVMGVVVWVRGRRARSRHGLLIVLVALLAAGAWAVVIASGALTTTSSDF
jgi:4-amino-4-deoxy-L-arabinose transferase-like glycosyltransferase